MQTKVIICALMFTADIIAATAQENALSTQPLDLHSLEMKADAGDSDAQLQLGVLYLGNYTIEADSLRAVGYLQRAADNGNLEAMYDLGICYICGSQAVARNTERGISLVRRAAENGFPIAQTCMGKICEQGTPCFLYSPHAKYPLCPIQMLKEAGGFLGCGGEAYGVVPYLKNDANALRWFTLAADSGEPAAMNELVRIYAKGECGATIDLRKSLDWLMRAAKNDISDAQCRLGRYYLDGYQNFLDPDSRKALEWFIRAADNGSADGAANAAAIYCGIGTQLQPNLTLAVYYSMRAANAFEGFNDKDFIDIGASILGELCDKYGEQLSPEFASDAIACLRSHAEKGNNDVQYHLAHIYFNGIIVDKDDKRGMYWLHTAAEQGSAKACWYLSLCYQLGTGTYANYSKAKQWTHEAARRGSREAIEFIEDMNKKGINY